MNAGLLAQYVMNGLMLGMMYALVAVGFTLFFGVLDVIKFSHGDVLTVGAFAALATFVGLTAAGLQSNWLALIADPRGRHLVDGLPRHADRTLSGVAAAHGARAQHPADHFDARHGAARVGAAVLSARRQSQAVPGAVAEELNRPRRLQSAARQRSHVGGRRARHRRLAEPCSTAPSSVWPSGRWRRTRKPHAQWGSTSPRWCSSPSPLARRSPRSPA